MSARMICKVAGREAQAEMPNWSGLGQSFEKNTAGTSN